MPAKIVPVMAMLKMFSMRGSELDVFRLLVKKPMTIKQIQKESRMSERMIRTHLGDLARRNFITKKVIEDRRLKYVYHANPPEIFRMAKQVVAQMEKSREKMNKDIVRGSKEVY